MNSPKLKTLATLLVFALFLPGASKCNGGGTSTDRPTTCGQNSDCSTGYVCESNRCVEEADVPVDPSSPVEPEEPALSLEIEPTIKRGGNQWCELNEAGLVQCARDDGRDGAEPAGQFAKLSVGGSHACVLSSEGAASCWGSNQWGQLNVPDHAFQAISAGDNHTCGLKSDDTIECWGFSTAFRGLPTDIAFANVSAGAEHTCAITSGGRVECFGDSRGAELPTGLYKAVSAGDKTTCALSQRGVPVCASKYTQVVKAPRNALETISAGRGYACGVAFDGRLDCWGDDLRFDTDLTGYQFQSVSVDGVVACGLLENGKRVCWPDLSAAKERACEASYAGTPDVSGVFVDGECHGVRSRIIEAQRDHLANARILNADDRVSAGLAIQMLYRASLGMADNPLERRLKEKVDQLEPAAKAELLERLRGLKSIDDPVLSRTISRDFIDLPRFIRPDLTPIWAQEVAGNIVDEEGSCDPGTKTYCSPPVKEGSLELPSASRGLSLGTTRWINAEGDEERPFDSFNFAVVALAGDLEASSLTDSGMVVIDISTPSSPQYPGGQANLIRDDLTGHPSGINLAMVDTGASFGPSPYAVLASHAGSGIVMDDSGWTGPGGSERGAVAQSGALQIISLYNPWSPEIVQSFPGSYRGAAIDESGEYLFTYSEELGALKVFHLGDLITSGDLESAEVAVLPLTPFLPVVDVQVAEGRVAFLFENRSTQIWSYNENAPHNLGLSPFLSSAPNVECDARLDGSAGGLLGRTPLGTATYAHAQDSAFAQLPADGNSDGDLDQIFSCQSVLGGDVYPGRMLLRNNVARPFGASVVLDESFAKLGTCADNVVMALDLADIDRSFSPEAATRFSWGFSTPNPIDGLESKGKLLYMADAHRTVPCGRDWGLIAMATPNPGDAQYVPVDRTDNNTPVTFAAPTYENLRTDSHYFRVVRQPDVGTEYVAPEPSIVKLQNQPVKSPGQWERAERTCGSYPEFAGSVSSGCCADFGISLGGVCHYPEKLQALNGQIRVSGLNFWSVDATVLVYDMPERTHCFPSNWQAYGENPHAYDAFVTGGAECGDMDMLDFEIGPEQASGLKKIVVRQEMCRDQRGRPTACNSCSEDNFVFSEPVLVWLDAGDTIDLSAADFELELESIRAVRKTRDSSIYVDDEVFLTGRSIVGANDSALVETFKHPTDDVAEDDGCYEFTTSDVNNEIEHTVLQTLLRNRRSGEFPAVMLWESDVNSDILLEIAEVFMGICSLAAGASVEMQGFQATGEMCISNWQACAAICLTGPALIVVDAIMNLLFPEGVDQFALDVDGLWMDAEQATGIFREGRRCVPDVWESSENSVSSNRVVEYREQVFPNNKKKVTLVKEYTSKVLPGAYSDEPAIYRATYNLIER